MRKINFRAWDGLKMFHDVLPLTCLGDNITLCVGSKGFNRDIYNIETNIDCEAIAVMQYTGLKDSKHTEEYPEGQEGYENDIIRERKSVGVIVFKDGRFEVDWKINADFWSEAIQYHLPNGEIIGNTFENPELLEE